MAIGALDGTHGVGICGWDDPGFHQPSQRRSLLPSLKELRAPGPADPAPGDRGLAPGSVLSQALLHLSPTSHALPQQYGQGSGIHCPGWH